jgi:flagellar biosynthesis/type III secretory pathway protein FliH
MREARLFRAALADAFDALAAELIRALAADVLGRELKLAPVDVALLARRLVAERRADEPLALRVCPADAHIACELPLIPDPELQPGDAVLVCRNGEIDARLTIRLAQVLAAVKR